MKDRKKPRRKRNFAIVFGFIGFLAIIALFSISFIYEKNSDPVRIEVIDITEDGKILYKITHLNDGRIDYVFNFTENLGTSSIDKMP